MSRRLTLLPLGVGAGTTSVLHGEPSSSFAILVDGVCQLLVDLGHGVARSAQRHLKEVPRHLYISHNHTDHTGDLPVVARAMASRQMPLTIWCTETVRRRVQAHRLHEFVEAGLSPASLASWRDTPVDEETEISADLSLVTRRSQHSEACFGFVMSHRGAPVLGYSADSGYNEGYYEWLGQAPVLVLDGRVEESADHAGFETIEAFAATLPGKRIYVTHYGRLDQPPVGLQPLRPGEPITLLGRP